MLIVATNSYITLADARQYALEQGLDLPQVDADAITLLTRAAKALDRRFAGRYLGVKAKAANAMQWPRLVGVVGNYRGDGEVWNQQIDSDGNPRDLSLIPVELGEAQVEMALYIDAGADALLGNADAIKSESTSVGDLTTSVTYANSSAPTSQFNTVYVILRPLLKQNTGLKMTRGN